MRTLTGGSWDDYLRGFGGNDTITGNAGDDRLAGDSGADTIDGGAGDNSLFGGGVYLVGSGKTILLDHGVEKDTLKGGDGDDIISAGYGDNVDGGANGTSGDTLYISFMGASAGLQLRRLARHAGDRRRHDHGIRRPQLG